MLMYQYYIDIVESIYPASIYEFSILTICNFSSYFIPTFTTSHITIHNYFQLAFGPQLAPFLAPGLRQIDVQIL